MKLLNVLGQIVYVFSNVILINIQLIFLKQIFIKEQLLLNY